MVLIEQNKTKHTSDKTTNLNDPAIPFKRAFCMDLLFHNDAALRVEIKNFFSEAKVHSLNTKFPIKGNHGPFLSSYYCGKIQLLQILAKTCVRYLAQYIFEH